MLSSKPRPKKCKVCAVEYLPQRMGQKVCGRLCAQKFARDMTEKSRKVLEKAERMADRAKREEMKTKPQLEKEVEEAMNRYVRLRDWDDGCISCGRAFVRGSLGGDCDAGHFRSKGSAKHLRFDPRNVHAQCKHCNDFLAGNPIGYEKGLIAKIGKEAVEALKFDQEPRRHTRDELREMRAHYRQLFKELQSQRETESA